MRVVDLTCSVIRSILTEPLNVLRKSMNTLFICYKLDQQNAHN